jgi:hypothetical protein
MNEASETGSEQSLRDRATEAGWPDGLLERMNGVGWPSWKIHQALETPGWLTPPMLDDQVTGLERFTTGLRLREATWEDDERLSDLFANSTERLGDWDVTVHRSPNPFAQQRLQARWHLKLVVEDHLAIASSAYSGRSSIVAGQRLSVGWMGGWRVRNSHRKGGYAALLMNTAGAASNVFGMMSYWYVRMENATAVSWIDKRLDTMRIPESRETNQLTASVMHIDTANGAQPSGAVRLITADDLPRCVELINRTHNGLDLFRPYSVEGLSDRLDDLFWGPRPPFVPEVYGWADMYVLEEHGQIAACAGLWDRGRDVREHWHNRATGEDRVDDTACVMDFGFAAERPDAMAELIRHLTSLTLSLGRGSLTVPLEFLPDVAVLCDWADRRVETRRFESMLFGSPEIKITARVTRPYTDLAYW